MDRLIYSVIKVIPVWIKPNHLSILRIIMVGPIVALLLIGQNLIAVILFVLTALLDTFDGILARVRSQKTKEGEWLDPFADKVLILSLLLFYGWFRLPIWLIITIVILEIFLVFGRPIKIKLKRPTQANIWGKIKMGCQSIALTGLISGFDLLKPVVILFFLLAICFAFLSLLAHLFDIFYHPIENS